MVKPFDLTKFRKTAIKKLGINDGFYDPVTWLDTGNFALNRMISGDFKRGVPLGAVTCIAGESGSGKFYIASGNLVSYAQRNGITPILLDSEGALYETWVKKLGVDIDPKTIYKAPVSLIDDVAAVINEVMEQYRDDNAGKARHEQQKVLFVVDSLGFLGTPTEKDQFEKNDMKGDMGRKPRQLKSLVSQCIRLFTGWEVGLVCTNHTYKSQNMYDPDDVISGGARFVFASSVVIAMNKAKLKEDEDGNKTKEVNGIRAKIKCVKSRFAKPFEEVEVRIPYDTGMNPYSGLFEMLENKGAVERDGSRYIYKAADGTQIKDFRKNYTPEILERIMSEFSDESVDTGIDDTPEDVKIALEEIADA